MGLLSATALLAVSVWWRSAWRPVVVPPGGAPSVSAIEAPMPGEVALPPVVAGSDIEHLRARQLVLPVEAYDVKNLRDNFRDPRGTRVHAAIDLMAPRGTRVRAADDGYVRRLITTARGGISIYQFDPTGRYCYFYAHLDRYAPFLVEGKLVRKGEVLGYVGTTGNAPPSAPHLHFAIFKVEAPHRWWSGTPINPYVLWASALE